MACGSCGARAAARGSARRTLWVLVTPDGRKKTYATEAEAKRVQSRLGGVITSKTS